MSPWILIAIYAGLALSASFLCSILEAVLLSTRIGHISLLESEGSRAAPLWKRFKEDPERPLTAILTLNTVAHTVGALGVGTQVAVLNDGQYVMAIASALLTVGVLLFSEILPKTIGTLYWKSLCKPSAFILQGLIGILIWVVVPIELIRGLFPSPEQETVSREELVALADIGEAEGAIERDEEAVITNLLRLREIEVGEIMTPRVVMVTVDVHWTVGDTLDQIPIMTHARMPVHKDSVDDIRGFVLRTDILRSAASDDHETCIADLMRPVGSCASTQSVDTALDLLLDQRLQILIVKDEFGGTTGLLSMEDVIETLLGVEIIDEADQEAIEEGTGAEDLREFAKEKFGLDNGEES